MKLEETYNKLAELLGERYENVLLKEASKQDVEEFKTELKEKFFKKFKGLLDAKSIEDKGLNFSLESALYWFGNDYHMGQSDIWYAVMSSSDYRPGRSEGSIEDTEDNTAEMFYDFLEKDQKRKEKRVDENLETRIITIPNKELSLNATRELQWFNSNTAKGVWIGSYDKKFKPTTKEAISELLSKKLIVKKDPESDIYKITKAGEKLLEKISSKKIDESTKEQLKPLIYVTVTYDDGDVLKTGIRQSLEDAKKYYLSMGNVVKFEDEETGKEYKHKAVKVELAESVQLKESKEETYFRLNDLKKLLISKEIGIEDWTDRDGTPGFTMFLIRHNNKHTQFTKPVTKEQFEKLQNKLLESVSGKIWTLADMRNFIKSDKDLVDKVACIDFVHSGHDEYDSEENFFEFKDKVTGKEFTLSEPLDNKELKMFLLKKTK